MVLYMSPLIYKEGKMVEKDNKEVKLTKAGKLDGRSRSGFANETPEARKARIAKGAATRRKNNLKKREKVESAKELRSRAKELQREAEGLLIDADALDGDHTSKSSMKSYEAQRTKEITEQFGRIVSEKYLKGMIINAIKNRTPTHLLTTPTMAAMDIMNDPDASVAQKEKAMKTLIVFENAKPAVVEEVETGIGSVEKEIDKLITKHGQVGPKRYS